MRSNFCLQNVHQVRTNSGKWMHVEVFSARTCWSVFAKIVGNELPCLNCVCKVGEIDSLVLHSIRNN